MLIWGSVDQHLSISALLKLTCHNKESIYTYIFSWVLLMWRLIWVYKDIFWQKHFKTWYMVMLLWHFFIIRVMFLSKFLGCDTFSLSISKTIQCVLVWNSEHKYNVGVWYGYNCSFIKTLNKNMKIPWSRRSTALFLVDTGFQFRISLTCSESGSAAWLPEGGNGCRVNAGWPEMRAESVS
jgi:hypothetical protein